MLSKLFNKNKILKKYNKIIKKSNNIDYKISALSDIELKSLTLKSTKLEEKLSCLKEISHRTVNLKPFNTQLLGVLTLLNNKLAEMKTGEGKTLTTGLAAVLRVLNGEKVFIVTVNSYLAKRDAELNKPILDFLNIKLGIITENQDHNSKQMAYNSDIVYGTNSEFAFDYLRDNMVMHPSHRVNQVKKDGTLFDSVIIDEIDSILIDESRTPLVISGESESQDDSLIIESSKICLKLKEGYLEKRKEAFSTEEIEHGDFIIDRKIKNIILTEKGLIKAEKLFNIENMFKEETKEFNFRLMNALRALYLFERGKDYIVKEDKIILIDQSTGRLTPNRQLNEGLHQAIESKEKVTITKENTIKAEITYQNFFKLFKSISGTTGTAKTEEEELLNTYGLEVIEIPTNKPIARIDNQDLIFLTKESKIKYLIDLIKSSKGQPILIGTASVEENEMLAKILKSNKISFNQLNAKNESLEAEIIKNAGNVNTITLATNMAGRGVDIKLTEESKLKGGLFVIGFGRYKNRRIDNQLRGRAGRQGDPGKSLFLISLEDELIKIFGGEKIKNMAAKFGFKDSDIIESSIVSRTIDKSQKAIENQEYEQRKELLKFDSVLSTQRLSVYEIRNNLLKITEFKDLKYKIKELINSEVNKIDYDSMVIQEDFKNIKKILHSKFNITSNSGNYPESKEQLIHFIDYIIFNKFKEFEVSDTDKLNLLRALYLEVIDKNWQAHLDMLSSLKTGAKLEAYNQKDPLVQYQKKGFDIYKNNFLNSTTAEILFRLINLEVNYKD